MDNLFSVKSTYTEDDLVNDTPHIREARGGVIFHPLTKCLTFDILDNGI